MLRARREARQGGYPQDPRYAQAGGRSRLRDRNQGYPADPYGYNQPQYDQPQQYGPPQDQYGYAQQQYNQPPPYDQQYGQPYSQQQYPQPGPSQWAQPPDPRKMYAPEQYAQQPPAPPYGYEVAPQQNQAYAPAQLAQLPPKPTGPRPCVIPQMTHKRFSGENMSPFVRARVPELESQITSHELIVFIDELNEAFMANPALQATNNVANVAGMAPSMMVQMIGMGVNVAAGIGSSVTTKVRTKKYLAHANETLFHPKGLHVQMCKTDKMLEYVGLGGQQNVFLKQQYRHAFESAQQVPVSGGMENYNHPIMQRMSSLGDRVMGLSFENVEAATAPDGFWKKWGAKEASKAEQKQQEKMMKDQAKEERRAGRRGGRGSSRRQERNDEKKAKEAKKILWIVIMVKEETAGEDDEWDSESEEDHDAKQKHQVE